MPTCQLPMLHGIHAIVYALFDENEELDRKAMRRQIEVCLKAGVHGIAALGLATEVSKLSKREKFTIIEWVAEDNAGRVPLAITISGPSIAEQIEQARCAERLGADWLILQPPAAGNYSASEYIDFFCAVARSTALPVAIQNAPAFLGRGLAVNDIIELRRNCPNFSVIKAEASAVDTAALIEATNGSLPIFNGRAGLELVDNLDVGCRGLILAPDCIDYAVQAYNRYRAGEIAAANAIYRTVAPAIIFEMQGIETLICYGKRLFCARAGFKIVDRAPALRPTAAGLRLVKKYADELGPMNAIESRSDPPLSHTWRQI
ncbi:MAG: dihydrodipicolinate synthase family protein [Albidovulum sp.]|nr:dihydrodipicolinate synthase family protein [Albidovulum sp.]